MNIATVFAILSYLASNKDLIKQAIVDIQNLIPDAPGNDKAAAVKGFIASALNIESQIESVWPLVAPVFNAFVAVVKGKTA
jgi:hypothetical protein